MASLVSSAIVPPEDVPSAGGVPQGREGLILQRGGEELLLQKAGDRFTLRPEGTLPSSFWQGIPIQRVRVIPGSALIEVQVEPEQLEGVLDQVRRHPQVRFASHVYGIEGNPQGRLYLSDELTIQLAQPLAGDRLMELLSPLGIELEKPVGGLDQTFVGRVSPQARENPIKLANRLLTLPEVQLAEANVLIRSLPHYRPREPLYPQQWYLHHNGSGADFVSNAHIALEQAWDITRGDRSVVVAIADDGIDLTHPDFQGPGKIVAPRDLHDKDFSPLPHSPDDNHGTAVAGIAIAEENGSGMIGVAPGCALMPIRTTGFLDDTSVEDVFNWAVNQGASVICCSWGAGAVKFPLSLRQRAAITRAATKGRNGKGCIVIFAAGNFNRPLNSTVQEQGWPRKVLNGVTQWLNGYAVHPDVITVSACTSLNQKAAYSNWGDEVFICAPSNNAAPAIWLEETGYIEVPPQKSRTYPGARVITSDRRGASGYDRGDFTDAFGGTSAACPLVAGVVALMLSANPALSVAEVKRLLQQTSDKIVDRGQDSQFGLSLGTYESNGHSKWFGYGKLNALRAVQSALALRAGPVTPAKQIQGSNTTAVAIADQREVSSSIQVQDQGLIKSIWVAVDLDHGFLGDVEVYLLAPSGDRILLQNRTLGRRTQLKTRFTPDQAPNLKRLLQKPTLGVWQLVIKDHASGHTGTLNQWQLTLGL